MERLVSFLGLISFIILCWLMSENRKKIIWRPVIGGCVLQFVFALFILKTPFGRKIFELARDFFNGISSYSLEGSRFVFGPLVDFSASGKAFGPENAFIFAFHIAGTIILFSSLMAVLYHLGIMQRIVQGFAFVMQYVMGTSGSESLSSAANIFLGQTEAPLIIRPYLVGMTRSELMAMMTGGMATIAGSVLAAYVGFGIDAGHLLAASVMSAPATLAIAKMMIPETAKSETEGHVKLLIEKSDTNVLDAACRGAGEGAHLAFNVMAMLIGFIALVAMLNGLIGWAGRLAGFESVLSLQGLLSYAFAPFAWLMGVPTSEILPVGSLLGTKTVLNEFIAYRELGTMSELSPRATIITTYALCGFANFSSIAIQIGGTGSLIPSRRKDLAALGLKSMIGGTLASFMTAAIAGMLI